MGQQHRRGGTGKSADGRAGGGSSPALPRVFPNRAPPMSAPFDKNELRKFYFLILIRREKSIPSFRMSISLVFLGGIL